MLFRRELVERVRNFIIFSEMGLGVIYILAIIGVTGLDKIIK